MASKIKGKCKYCGKEYTRSYITRHLASCKARAERLEKEGAKRQTGYFELFISGRYDPDMWLVIEADENVKLTEIDRFLRDIWLECCGHMSAFTIDGKEYSSHP